MVVCTFKTWQVSRYARVSRRQLQWWEEKRLLRSQVIGHTRMYSLEQMEMAKRIGELRHHGASLQDVRRILKSGLQWESVRKIRKPTVINGVLVIS